MSAEFSSLDQSIGDRLKQARLKRRLSQRDVGERAGVSHQQVHKYESGLSEIAASKLYTLAEILQVPFDYFFHDLPEFEATESSPQWLSPIDRHLVGSFRDLEPSAQATILRFIASLKGERLS